MNNEKYKDPTAEYAIAEAEKWEKRQQELEEKHGIKRGDVIQIIQTSYASGDGKIITKKVKARIKVVNTVTDIMMICSRHMIYIHGDLDRKIRCRKGKGPD